MGELINVCFVAKRRIESEHARARACMANNECPLCGEPMESRSLLAVLPVDGVAMHISCHEKAAT
jgi:hypothetical protein